MYTLLSEQNLTKLKTYFQNQSEVDLVYLFGSQVTEKTHFDSDLDVGVLLDKQVEPSTYLDYQIRISSDLIDLLHFVDFVFKTIQEYLDGLYTQKIYSEGLTRRIQEGEYGHLKRSHRISLEGIRKLSQKIREDR